MRILVLFMLVFGFSFSATITVNDAGDTDANDTKCTLREAIKLANNSTATSYNGCSKSGTGNDDTIVFAGDMNINVGPPSYTIDFTQGNLTIDGGDKKIFIINNTGGALFTLSGNGTLTLKRLNLTGGQVASVGINQTLLMDSCFVGYALTSDVLVNNGGTIKVWNTTFVDVQRVINSAGGLTHLSFITVKTTSSLPVIERSDGNIFVKNSIFDVSSDACNTSIGIDGFGVVYGSNVDNCPSSFTFSYIGLDFLDFHGGNVKVYSLSGDSVAVNSISDCSDLDGINITKDARGKDRNKNGKKCDAGAFELLYNVSVNVVPSNAGSVSGAGEYEKGANVNLSAQANTGYEFERWGGDCLGTTPTFSISNLNSDKTCTARFKSPGTYTLTVNKRGSGTITSSPAGINCGSQCSASFSTNTSITLTATPDQNSTFAGWGGDCQSCGNNNICQIPMNSDKTCIATFNTSGESGVVFDFQKPVDTGNTPISGPIFVESDNLIASARFIPTSISVPEGYSIRYSRAIEIEVVALTPMATLRIVYPEAIKRGAKVYKIVGQSVYDITSMVDIRGSTITFMIGDNSIYDGNSTQGIIKDPIVLMEPLQEPASGGGGGCSTGGFGNSLLAWVILFGLIALRRFKGRS